MSRSRVARLPLAEPEQRHPSPGFWHHPPHHLFDSTSKTAVVAVKCLGFLVAASFAGALVAPFVFGPAWAYMGRLMFVLLIAIPLGALYLGMFLRAMAAEPSLTKKDLALIDDSRRDLLVQVAVLVRGKVRAFDRGILGLSDGALFFSGHCFSFLIGSQDVAERRAIDVRLGSPFVTALDLKHEDGRLRLQFRVVKGGPWSDRDHIWQLSDLLHAIRNSPPTKAERRYPPLHPPGPGLPDSRSAREPGAT